MIGVLCKASERAAAAEFFELFKTPWEFHRADRHYDVVLSATGELPAAAADLVLIYSSESTSFDSIIGVAVTSLAGAGALRCQDDTIPLYRDRGELKGNAATVATEDTTRQPLAIAGRTNGAAYVRLGYNLFSEIHTLLSEGQPAESAGIPTLELHIALLRDLILNHSLPLVEVTPAPDGFPFAVCLTHDVDHPSIRLHRLDHTTVGFLHRATAGSVVNLARGRISFGRLLKNLWAAMKLPFVHLRLAADFWLKFDRYLELEKGLGSTFFIIPESGNPGRGLPGKPPRKMRAANYGIDDIADHARKFVAAGGEVGLHGIDAWADVDKAQAEKAKIAKVTGAREIGVRMHWLYFAPSAPAILEKAGFSYDSTMGFNSTVGYRCGTGQPHLPTGCSCLLELPLQIMDTSLFYPTHLNLNETQAAEAVEKIVSSFERWGGALTINWHDRSLAPERLWDEFYVELISRLKARRPWFATAGTVVAWYRSRRQITFETVEYSGCTLRIVANAGPAISPGFTLRVHHPRKGALDAGGSLQRSGARTDVAFHGRLDAKVEI